MHDLTGPSALAEDILFIHVTDLHCNLDSDAARFSSDLAATVQCYVDSHEWGSSAESVCPKPHLILSGDVIDSAGGTAGRDRRYERASQFIEAWKQHSQGHGASSDSSVMVVPGNHDCDWQSDVIGSDKEVIFGRFAAYRRFSDRFITNSSGVPSPADDPVVADLYRVGNRLVLFLGFNSAHFECRAFPGFGFIDPRQLSQAKRAVEKLRSAVPECALACFAVTHHSPIPLEDSDGLQKEIVERLPGGGSDPGTGASSSPGLPLINAGDFVRRLTHMGCYCALTGHLHEEGAVEVSYGTAPSFKCLSPRGYYLGHGVAILHLSLRRCKAHYAVYTVTKGKQSLICDDELALESASDASFQEYRLKQRVDNLVRDHQAWTAHASQRDMAGYKSYVDDVFRNTCVVPTHYNHQSVPLRPTRRSKHSLFLVLDEHEGEPFLLMNTHPDRAPTEVSSWDAPLFPAVRTGEELHFWSRVRLNLLEKGARALSDSDLNRSFRAAEGVRDILNLPRQRLGQDRFRRVDARPLVARRLSPTTGEVAEYRYRLYVPDCVSPAAPLGSTPASHLRILPRISDLKHAMLDSLRQRAISGYFWMPVRFLVHHELPAMEARNGDVVAWVLGQMHEHAASICYIDGAPFDPIHLHVATNET